MLWEELRSDKFKESIKESEGVCLLPIGVLEKHGNHLPVGTDMIIGQAVCKKAAETEKAVVFPYYFLGQIAEAKHYPGCIAASHKLIMKALLEMCDEIHRNGFKKIIICSSHGGNGHFLPFFLQEMPRLERRYSAYTFFLAKYKDEQEKKIASLAKTNDLGFHAGLTETALIMHLRGDLVDMKAQDTKEAASLDRLKNIRKLGIFTGYNWYSQYPYHFAGDPAPATAELGKIIFDMSCDNLREVIKEVKADNEYENMNTEFKHLSNNL